jgi:hypothetical protein
VITGRLFLPRTAAIAIPFGRFMVIAIKLAYICRSFSLLLIVHLSLLRADLPPRAFYLKSSRLGYS